MSAGEARRLPYLPALFVAVLPLAVMVFLQWVPRQLVSEDFIKELKPWCLVQGVNVDLKPIQPAPPCHKVPAPPDTSRPDQVAGQKVAQTDTAAQGRGAPKTTPQLRALELRARIDFGAISALLQVVAVLAAGFAITQMIAGWRTQAPRPTPDGQSSPRVPKAERVVVVCLALFGIVAGIAFAVLQMRAHIRDLLIRPPIEAAEKAGLMASGLLETLDHMVAYNYLFAFVGAGLLLAYLAALSIDSPAPMSEEDRIVGLQFVLGIGAALFTTGILANKAGIAMVKGVLDETSSKELLAALDRLPDVWALAYSGFLVTAIAAAYFAIRGGEAKINETPKDGDAVPTSALAVRTPDGKDFKAFGWLINMLVALTPVWLTEGLAKLLDAAGKIPQ